MKSPVRRKNDVLAVAGLSRLNDNVSHLQQQQLIIALLTENHYHLRNRNKGRIMNKPRTNPAPPVPTGTPALQSQQLFSHTREIKIEHAGEVYRLSLTSNNKLILTK
ncbi:hemin uptake protein HemP [Craterilacuibacter sp. RT1T]|nr:hemin uptake protein HemP [Craterilacuibacter sp. RT1T]MCL6262368.1 hemin uptake protein HemP [Craterilacuibacter sp. RT1T]